MGFKDGQPLSFVATDVGNNAKVGGIITGQLITTVILSAVESDETMASLREALTKRPVDAIRVILAGDVIIEKSVNDDNGRKLMNKFNCFYQSLDNRGLSLPTTGVPQSQTAQPGSASAGAASVARSQDKLPDAKALLTKYRVAIGGAEAFAGKKSMQWTGSFHIPAQRLTAEINIWSERPNRYVCKFTIPGFGDIRSGYTGEVGWALDPGDGPRLLEGAEAQQAKHDAEFELFLRPDALVKVVTTVERTKFSGRDCFKVKVEWKSGRESFDYYSSETGLLIGTSGKQGFKTRSVEVVNLIDDYKIFDGINMPTKYTTKFSGTEQVIALKEIKFDGIAASVFDPPPEVKALFPKSRSASSVNSKMTNDEVIQLITAGLSEQVVITSIRQASTKDFDLTPKGLIALKKAGVPDAVIVVMQE